MEESPTPTASKRPRTFDIEALTKEAITLARKRCANAENLEDEPDDSCSVGEKALLAFDDPAADQSDGSSDTEDEEAISNNVMPINYRLSIVHSPHSNRPITALALDKVGDRLVSGSADCTVSLWDFQSLNPNCPNRNLQPCGAHQIRQLDFGDGNELFLVVAACAQAKVLDRTGKEHAECIKGDQYLVDMAKTKGHVSALNGGQWHPHNRQEFMTYGDDSTIRFWNVEEAKQNNKSIIKVKPLPGVAGKRQTTVKSALFSKSGHFIYASAEDGGMYSWDKRRSLLTPLFRLKSNQWDFMSISYSDNLLACRNQEKLCIFDVRTRKQFAEWSCEMKWPCDFAFSPDDCHLVYGGEHGLSAVPVTGNGDPELLWPCKSPIRRVRWHPRIYQIFCGTHAGIIEAMCDDSTGSRSQRGILRGTRTQTKVHNKKEFFSNELVINPLALPMFRQEKIRNLSLLRVRQRNSAARSRRPELPISGAGENGRIGHHGSTLSSYIVKNIALQQVPSTKEDPREALLKYAEKAEKEPYWVAPAYAKTQPKPIYEEPSNDESKEE